MLTRFNEKLHNKEEAGMMEGAISMSTKETHVVPAHEGRLFHCLLLGKYTSWLDLETSSCDMIIIILLYYLRPSTTTSEAIHF